MVIRYNHLFTVTYEYRKRQETVRVDIVVANLACKYIINVYFSGIHKNVLPDLEAVT